MGWLPGPPLQERQTRLATLLTEAPKVPQSALSELVSEEQVLFFSDRETKTQSVGRLVRALRGRDPSAMLDAVWEREAEGALRIAPDVAIMRGRVESVHHIRAAIGLCRKGIADPYNPRETTRVFVLFVGPVNQSRLHAGLLVRISKLFHDRYFVKKLLAAKTQDQVLRILHAAEFPQRKKPMIARGFHMVLEFFKNRYAFGCSSESR